MSDYVFSLSPRKDVNEEDDWDRYSENIRPTRKGRKVEALRAKPEVVPESVAVEKLDDILNNLNLEVNEPDSLTTILEYCAWFESAFTIGHHKLLYKLLWRVVNKPGFLEKYANDDRLLKFWEKLADNSAGHGHDIFQFAIARKSLLRCAALYTQWSQCVEMANAFVEARRVLLLARANCALPLEEINRAEDELEMREMRRNMESGDGDDISEDEETRKAFTRLQTMGDHNEAPIVRLPSLVSDPNQKSLRLKSEAKSNQSMQPFEVFATGNADDVEYLMGVHELDAHIERYAMTETQHPKLKDGASANVQMKPATSCFNVWTVEDETTKKVKAKLVIKQIFKTMSFEEYAFEFVHCKEKEEPPKADPKNTRRKLF